MQNRKKVGVVYLSFHCEPYIDDVVKGMAETTYPHELVEFIIVDNPHPKFGSSSPFLEQTVMPRSDKDLPHVTLMTQTENTGFAGGNNIGVAKAKELGCDYVIFHNNDGYFAPECIEKMVEAMEADPTIGVSQALILLDPEKDLINTTGNAYHYAGFGYCEDYRRSVTGLTMPAVKDIAYASGAAFMMPMALIDKIGAWDHDFFLYHEDTELSFRARVTGHRVVCVRDAVFYHKYEFSRSISKYYWMERNRFAVMLMYYSWWSLLLVLPILIPLEFGLWLFAFKGGWWKERAKVVGYWIQPQHWKLWLNKRKKIQVMKKISDQELLANATGEILFQEKDQQHWLVTKVGNPIIEWYRKNIFMRLIK